MDAHQQALMALVARPRPLPRPDGEGWMTTAEIGATADPPLSRSATGRRMQRLVDEGLAERLEIPDTARGGTLVFYRLKGLA